MRIALVSDWWAPRIGGIESQLTDLAAALARRGHHVRVLTTTRDPVLIPGVQGAPNVAVEHVAVPMIGDIAVPDLRRIGDLARLLAADRPDVVHAHGMFSPLAAGAVLAAQRLRIASVVTVHSLLAPWPVFAAAGVVLSLFTNRATVLTAVSRAVAADLERASGREVAVVPNGLDVDAWRVPRTVATGEVRIVGVVRLVPKKRPTDLLDAFKAALRANPVLNLRLTVAGGGPMQPQLERVVARRHQTDRVAFAGGCSRDDIRALLARASIFAHPGRREAFGLALLEARAAGVPAVAMAAGGVPELIEHGRTGLLASTQAEFGRHLSTLAGDAGLRARLGAAAGEHLDAFTWTAVTGGYEDIYRRALAAIGAPANALQ